MSDRERAPASPGEEPDEEASSSEGAREAALIRKVMRVQEKHREGGIEPDLDVDDQEPEPDA